MASRRTSDTPEFDFDAVAEVDRASPEPEEPADWQEVPQARFLSWKPGEQLAYCAARDYCAAEHETDPEWCQFYIGRAQGYERRLQELRG